MNEKVQEQIRNKAGNERNIDRNSVGNAGKSKIDFQCEFKEAFTKSMFYEKMAETTMAYLDAMNPCKEILPNINDLDEKARSSLKESLQADMQDWLQMWRDTLMEGKTLPIDLIGLASDIARKDRERINE